MNQRPSGIKVAATISVLGSLINLYFGLQGIIVDLTVLPLLWDPYKPEWYKIALPIELVLDFFMVALAFLALCIVYGLWAAKSWSYNNTHAIPIFAGITSLSLTALYMSISAEANVGVAITNSVLVFLFDLVWIIVVWFSLMKPNVKQYLKRIPQPVQ